jgi:hypothetical protein
MWIRAIQPSTRNGATTRSVLNAYDTDKKAETERPRLFLALQINLKVPSGYHMEIRVLSSALTAIVASLTVQRR